MIQSNVITCPKLTCNAINLSQYLFDLMPMRYLAIKQV
jgi:hypothetical protein